MRNPLSKKVETIQPSGIRKFFDIVSEMEDVISLGVGEPDFDTPWHIRDEGIYTLEKGRTFYTSNSGLKELRVAIAEYLRRRFEVSYDPLHEILVTVGGSEGIDVALRAMLDPGDEVLIPEPCYVSYVPCVVLADGVPVTIELKEENQFRLTKEELLAAITDKTKILVMPFPNNPTGGVMRREDLEEIAQVCIEKDIYVLSDEIYSELTYGADHVSIASLPGMKERTLLINGFSKVVCDDRMAARLYLRTAGDRGADDKNSPVCDHVCTDEQSVCGGRGAAARRMRMWRRCVQPTIREGGISCMHLKRWDFRALSRLVHFMCSRASRNSG